MGPFNNGGYFLAWLFTAYGLHNCYREIAKRDRYLLFWSSVSFWSDRWFWGHGWLRWLSAEKRIPSKATYPDSDFFLSFCNKNNKVEQVHQSQDNFFCDWYKIIEREYDNFWYTSSWFQTNLVDVV